MKKISKLEKKLNASAFAFVVALAATSYSHAQAATDTGPYVGLDAVYSNMKFKQDFGGNIFAKKAAPGLNLFVGHMFHENFGAELGIEFDKQMKKTAKVNAGNKVAGCLIDPNLLKFASYKTTVKQRHPYLGFIAKTNVLGDDNSVSLMVGVSLSHINAQYNYFESDLGTIDPSITRTFTKTKPVGVVRAAFEHKFNDNFGLRALATWRNTSQFKIKAKEKGANKDTMIKLKDTFNVGIGAVYYI